MLRQCKKCNNFLPLEHFNKHPSCKNGRLYTCKECIRKYKKLYQKINAKELSLKKKEFHKKYPWKKVLQHIKGRCNNINDSAYYRYGKREIKCLITEEEIKYLWFRDRGYLMKQPSIDRIDNDGNYELSNCQFIEKYLNSGKDKCKSVIQFDITGKFIKKWPSIKEANKSLKIVIHLERKTSGGFIWELKND